MKEDKKGKNGKKSHVYKLKDFTSVTRSCPTLGNPMNHAHQASLSITSSRSLPKPMSIEPVMPSNHLILFCPPLLLPSIFPSIRVFSNESALYIRWPKYWSISFNISPSSEHPGLISFRMDWLDLLAVQGTLKSLLQHHSFKTIHSSALSFLYSPTLTMFQVYSQVIQLYTHVYISMGFFQILFCHRL